MQPSQSAAHPGGSNVPGQGLCILIMDDDKHIRLSLSAVLETEGYRVYTAKDGGEGLATVARIAIDIAIIDILMPHVDGIEILRQLKKNHPAIQVIAMSGGGNVSAMDYLPLAVSLGATASLQKPFEAEALLDILARVTAGGI